MSDRPPMCRLPMCRRALRGLAIYLTLAATLFGGLIAGAPAGAAAGPSQGSDFALSEGSGTVFPGRSLILSVPNRSSLSSAEVHLSENAQPVSQPIVTPLSVRCSGCWRRTESRSSSNSRSRIGL